MPSQKKILVVTQHFWPENFRINDIVEGFLQDGIAVDVLCGLPNYPKGEWFPGYSAAGPFEEKWHGACLYRCKEVPRRGNTSVNIFLNYVSWPWYAAHALHRLPGGYDAVFCFNTSPVLMCWPAIRYAKKHHIPFTNYVLDLWPENLYSVLPVKNRFMRWVAQSVSDSLYRRCDRLIAMSGPLQERLCARTGLDQVFFGNSGAEANEGAIKCARKYSVTTYGPDRNKVLTLVNSFHGRTLATLTATGQDVFHKDFGPFPANFGYIPANDFDTFKAAVDDSVCAVMMEMVQGEGGVVALDADYVQSVADYCHAHDILIIVDEVQTGVGRTGTFLACEQFGLKPDLVTLAKGLGGGLPIGAVLASKKVADTMGPGSHGSTFGGNPVVCAGGCAVLDAMDDAFMRNVNARAAQLREGLASLPHVASVSGMGLMVGIAFADDVKAADVRAACERKGLLVLTAKTRLRLLPPLILSEADVAKALAILDDVLSSM